jgi:hypothetical protein
MVSLTVGNRQHPTLPSRGSRFLPCDLFQIDLEPEQKSMINLLNNFLYIEWFIAEMAFLVTKQQKIY